MRAKETLSASEDLQWRFFIEALPTLQESMESILNEEKILSERLKQERNNLIEEIISWTARPEGEELIRFLIKEFETSTSPKDEEPKTELATKQTTAEMWAVISESDRLRVMVEINLDKILESIGPEKLKAFTLYQASKHQRDENGGLTSVFVEDKFNELFGAYIRLVQCATYFLRQEDLLSLADMRKEGLVIYREHDTMQGSAVETLSHASDRAVVRRIFHRGLHYEHAELKERGTE